MTAALTTINQAVGEPSMQTTSPAEASAAFANLKRTLEGKTQATEQDLSDEFQKYLDYGVPIDQAVKTILRHHGVQTAAAPRANAPATGPLPIAQLPANSL